MRDMATELALHMYYQWRSSERLARIQWPHLNEKQRAKHVKRARKLMRDISEAHCRVVPRYMREAMYTALAKVLHKHGEGRIIYMAELNDIWDALMDAAEQESLADVPEQ